ncbi:hypothetical protein J6590_040536 [Homalodisca vitripennis]|nr:hypothetical protein J6590_040536 [Homalodisca vitripennis]
MMLLIFTVEKHDVCLTRSFTCPFFTEMEKILDPTDFSTFGAVDFVCRASSSTRNFLLQLCRTTWFFENELFGVCPPAPSSIMNVVLREDGSNLLNCIFLEVPSLSVVTETHFWYKLAC